MTADRILVLEHAARLLDEHAAYRSDCLEWQRALNVGYGVFNYKGQRYYCHRIACEIEHGPAPDCKPYAIHECDNKACVRPDHLRWGTHAENMKDAWARGPGRATVAQRTHCLNGHEINEANTAMTVNGWRRCKVCRRASEVRARNRT